MGFWAVTVLWVLYCLNLSPPLHTTKNSLFFISLSLTHTHTKRGLTSPHCNLLCKQLSMSVSFCHFPLSKHLQMAKDSLSLFEFLVIIWILSQLNLITYLPFPLPPHRHDFLATSKFLALLFTIKFVKIWFFCFYSLLFYQFQLPVFLFCFFSCGYSWKLIWTMNVTLLPLALQMVPLLLLHSLH